MFLGIAMVCVLLVSWFAIVITGRLPRGMFDFILRVNRFAFDLTAYSLLMTDIYPRYDGSEPTGVLPPGDDGTAPSGPSGSRRRPAAPAVGPAGRLT